MDTMAVDGKKNSRQQRQRLQNERRYDMLNAIELREK